MRWKRGKRTCNSVVGFVRLLVRQFVSNKWKRAFEMCVSLKVFFHVIVCQSLDDGFLDRPLNDAILDIRYAAAGRQVRILPSFVILF